MPTSARSCPQSVWNRLRLGRPKRSHFVGFSSPNVSRSLRGAAELRRRERLSWLPLRRQRRCERRESGGWRKEGGRQDVGERKGSCVVIGSCVFSQEEQRKQVTEEMQEEEMKAHRRSLGNIRFIGALFRLRVSILLSLPFTLFHSSPFQSSFRPPFLSLFSPSLYH